MENEIKFNVYTTVLRFLLFKITTNLFRIYLDINIESKDVILLAIYTKPPSKLELELLDDIETNSDAHLPDFSVKSKYITINQLDETDSHDFIVYAIYCG